jgi:type II secretory pathway component PulF
LTEAGVFPAEFVARYRTGETTGGLESALLALAADHQQRANSRLTAATVLYPAMLFAVVAAMVGYIVIGFVLNYVNTLNSLMAN